MSGLRWTTAGESHGAALVGILEGLPAGLELSIERIDGELRRRQGGYGRGGRMAIESDTVRVLSGMRAGLTLGSPLALMIENRDVKIEELGIPTSPRPGHADLAGCQKYGKADPRAILERASARETAMRVALGAAARQVLEAFGVRIFGYVVELGGLAAAVTEVDAKRQFDLRERSDFACLDPESELAWKAAVDAAKADGDTLGGIFEVCVTGLPPGLGTFQDPRGRMTSRLGAAMLAIPAIKGVEFGVGFESARLRGGEVHDAIELGGGEEGSFGRFGRASNRSGGLEGGMTTGAPLVLRAAMKPISTLRKGLETVEFGGGPVKSTYQRSDVTAVPAASVVGENVVALELASAFLESFSGASLEMVRASFETWRDRAVSL